MKYNILILFIFISLPCFAWDSNVYEVYQDSNFTAAESPKVLNVSQDLTTIWGSGETAYASSLNIYNTGKYDIQLELSMDGTTYGSSQTLGASAVDNVNATGVKKIRLTHTGNDSSYQIKAFSDLIGESQIIPGNSQVFIQDANTEPVDLFFYREDSTFTLAADTVASGVTTLQYDFSATTGHGLIANDYIRLEDTDQDIFAQVSSVSGNTITLDRPIDRVYAAATTTGEEITINMAVDGGVTPQIFHIETGLTPNFIRRFIVTITDQTIMDDAKFGGISALSNGLVLRIVNDFQKTIWSIKSNSDFAQWAYDLTYSDKAPAGYYGMRSRMTFGGQDKHGIILEIGPNDRIQWIVQDDLTNLDTLIISAQGNRK